MNAGGFGSRIGDAIESLCILGITNEVEEISGRHIRFRYRQAELPEGSVIVGVRFGLVKDSPKKVEARVAELLARRQMTQPSGVKSAGCIFKNPPEGPAGRLIDEAGLKGLAAGHAWVAREHANFIVHQGRATAAQVLDLIETVRAAVRKKYNIRLETEIKIIGRDEEVDAG
jgi:UDP-N-acetylmuramate dehydrogenase